MEIMIHAASKDLASRRLCLDGGWRIVLDDNGVNSTLS